MKKIAIIASIGLTFVAAGTLTAGLVSSNKAGLDSEVKAEIVASGKTYLSLLQSSGDTEWTSGGAKFGIYYFDDTVNPKKEGWSTDFASLIDSEAKVYTANYSLEFQPKKMIAVRFNSEASTMRWNAYDAENYVWNQSSNLDFKDAVCIYKYEGSWSESLATVKGLTGGDLLLNDYKESKEGGYHGESYKTGISLTAGNTFTISHEGNTYGTSASHLRVQPAISSNFEVSNNKIKCLVSGTYDLYFNVSGNDTGGNPNTHTLWIQTSAENAALAYANNFLTNFTCGGETGEHAGTVTAEEGTWDNLKTAWTPMTSGSKDYFLGVKDNPSETGTVYQQVMARYKYVIEKYGTDVYEDFMGAGYTKKLSSNAINLVENNGNNYTAIIIIAASVAVVSLSAAFIMLKKRKESR